MYNYFWDNLRQTSKFTLNGINTWCNFYFFLEINFTWLIWGNIACHRKYHCKEKCISCFGHQNLGAHSGILVWQFHWIIHWLDNNRPIVWETIDLLISKNFMGSKENSCYSVPSLGNLETYVNQSWCYKIFLIHNDLIFWGKRQNWLWLMLITDATFLM